MLTKTRFLNVTIWAILFLAAGAPPADAETPFDKGWQLRFGGVGVDSGLDFVIVDTAGHRHRWTSATGGVAVSGEYRFTPRLGVELGAIAAGEVDYDFNDSLATETLGFSSISTGLNVHLTPSTKVDVYAGPILAYVSYGDLSYRVPSDDPRVPSSWWVPGTSAHLSVGATFAFGASLGLDVRFGSRWSFGTALKYLSAHLDGTDGGNGRTAIDFNPLIVGLGGGYRF